MLVTNKMKSNCITSKIYIKKLLNVRELKFNKTFITTFKCMNSVQSDFVLNILQIKQLFFF